ncbi:MAG: hypothetical protein COB67_04070 [SAR324 cluster bacterium]|uniref:Tetratricopeptide repeat protein n=1 Tax=SAR324 cluster bacterium TaxID=2024889 RepID=A0A2A4T823_9DELT|nr:MAG: hypothetical protein COB67_04070 [SAR324 cluster bacterium]
MLESFAKKREAKAQQKAYEQYLKGCECLEGRLYKQAMIEFEKALKLDPKTMPTHLKNSFHSYASGGDGDCALSIGLVLLKLRPKDYKLANHLGNCARQQQNYKQANNLYRHALKVNKKYEIAFYNLAASMGKVSKFDEEVLSAVKQFEEVKDFILPDYYNNPQIVEELSEALSAENEKQRKEKIQELMLQKEQQEMTQELVALRVTEQELKKCEEQSDDPTFEQLSHALSELVQEKDPVLIYQGNLFNLGLYALSQKIHDLAFDCFSKLRKQKCQLDYLEMCLALTFALKNHRTKAIDFFIRLLGITPYNRYYNVNLGLLYRRNKNRLLCFKYLAVGAALLEKSDGHYRLSELKVLAAGHFKAGRYVKAIQLYEVVVSEQDDLVAWSHIGESHLARQHFEDAAEAFRRLQKLDPKSDTAQQKLRAIHNHYFDRGEEFFHASKYRAAAGQFEKAMTILKIAETIKRAAGVYQVLKNPNRVTELMEEYEAMLLHEKEVEQEERRQAYFLQGKRFMKKHDFNKAIENLELAFRMKLDKDVFMYLATIYKKLKRDVEMRDLLDRWNRMVEYEDRMKKFRKEEERSQKS